MASLNCQGAPSSSGGAVRHAAWANAFYAGDSAALRADVDRFVAGGKPLAEKPLLLICPHAGYIYSGPVAGKSYATLDRSAKTAIVLGPPHRKPVENLNIVDADYYETPLGRVPLDKKIIAELRKSPLVTADNQADAMEHSIEVQVPFLQVLLKNFTLVPIMVGGADPEAAARLLLPYAKSGTVIIASSDMSHFFPSDSAKKIDKRSIDAILSQSAGADIDACGERPIRVVMHLAKKLGLSPVLLDARNSFETTGESPDRVVGYSAFAYVKDPHAAQTPAPAADAPADLAPEVKTYLLKLARQSLDAAVQNKPRPDAGNPPAITRENAGCFVTLTMRGELRGCIGYIEGIKPLYEAVMDNAKNAALDDPRFSPVTPGELKDIKVEVSVLTKPAPLEYKGPQDLLDKLVPGRDGVILQQGYHQSTFLPQVWDQLPDKVQFLEHLSVKGGMPADGWKTANVKRYRAIHFDESK